MTPKQKYDERKRLRAERLLHEEQRKANDRAFRDRSEEAFYRLVNAIERIADVAELWAEKQA